jgi:uncharacterized protein YaeQ
LAIKSTVFKANLQIADMDRNYYAEHLLTLSRHPSETDERMMVRLLAFALNAHEYLSFGQGMTDDESADLWQKDLTGVIELWIDVGLPDEKLIRKACGRSKQVIVYSYGGRSAQLWFEQNSRQFERQKNLTIISIAQASSLAIANLAERTMQLQCNIQEGLVWLMNEKETISIELMVLKSHNEIKFISR